MKPAPFEYDDPHDLGEALQLLEQYGDDAKALAGGQSLIPLMNFWLAVPSRLVDLNHVQELEHLSAEQEQLMIGALTRHCTLERSSLIAQAAPLLAMAAAHIGHEPIRSRGTFGGSLAHADPAAELPTAVLALGATLRLQRSRGTRSVAAEDFFVSYFTTALEPDELLVAVEIPAMAQRTGCAFEEAAIKRGEFAWAGVAAVITLDDTGRVARLRLACLGVGSTPVLIEEAGRLAAGEVPSAELWAEVGQAASRAIDPPQDIHASTEYRRRTAAVLTRRATRQAAARAGGKNDDRAA